MYVCFSFHLNTSRLTKIAQPECENVVQCRGRREEKTPQGFNSNFLVLTSEDRKACNQKADNKPHLLPLTCTWGVLTVATGLVLWHCTAGHTV